MAVKNTRPARRPSRRTLGAPQDERKEPLVPSIVEGLPSRQGLDKRRLGSKRTENFLVVNPLVSSDPEFIEGESRNAYQLKNSPPFIQTPHSERLQRWQLLQSEHETICAFAFIAHAVPLTHAGSPWRGPNSAFPPTPI